MVKRVYTAKFKAERELEVLREEEQLGAIAARHNINPNLLRTSCKCGTPVFVYRDVVNTLSLEEEEKL